MTSPRPVPPPHERTGQRVYGDITTSRALARLTDDLVKLPGTQFGVGLDGLIGLVPGIGDLVGTGLSSAIMMDAVRQRVPLHILARMGFNMLLDTGLGFLPVVGDAADVAHRANRKNYRLLEKAVAEGKHVDTDVKTYVTRAVLMVVAFVVAALVMVGILIFGLLKLIGVL